MWSGSVTSLKMESLEEIAFKTLYHITSTLGLLKFQPLVSKSSLSLLYSQLTKQKIVDFIRQKLDQCLTNTIMNDQVRKKLVNHFSEHTSSKDLCQTSEPFLFLDCVLDEHFEDFELRISEDIPVKDENSDLVEVIANRSPSL